MVWFQCEDCGENLKKPKLAIHFNRCSAYKLSCIDCGVVFDQKSVQAHSSCVSEAEKYGPKGVNKGAAGPASKPKNGKGQNGLDVDFSRGLSTCAPWSCSLCNIKATSQETLEIHAGGKKHQSRCKAAAAKEKSKTQGCDTGVAAVDMNIGGGKKDDQKVQIEEDVQVTGAAPDATSLSAEKKRKKERIGEGDVNLTSLPSGNLEKRLKRGETSAVVGTSSAEKEDETLPESAGKDSQGKKRKLVEEQEAIVLEENGHGAGAKKSRKKGKQAAAPGEVNGHGDDGVDAPKVSGTSGIVGKDENGEKLKRKEKKRSQKFVLVSPLGNGSLSYSKEVLPGVEGAGDVELGSQSVDGKIVTGKKTKKSKGLPATPGKVQQDDTCKHNKKERKKMIELKEAIVHEISFREWLGEEDGTQGGTPTHPPHDISEKMKENLEHLQGVERAKQSEKSGTDSTQDGIAKVVKWKKIIREVLGKSLNGKLKKIELKRAVLPLAQEAIDSASISVDRKALKAELMRQVTSSPKFVVDGKHVMLAPKVQ